MREKEFISKYPSKEFTIWTYEQGDFYTYIVLYTDGQQLSPEEEDIFWALFPNSKTIYEDKEKETVIL